MKRQVFIITIIFLFAGIGISFANEAYDGGIRFNAQKPQFDGKTVSASVDVILDDLQMKSQSILTLVPRFVSEDGVSTYSFEPVVIGRRNALILYKRGELRPTPDRQTPQMVVKRKNRTPQQFTLNLNVPYQSWMRTARIVVDEYSSGCAMCDLGSMDYTVLSPLLGEPYKPTYQLAYVLPEAEAVKVRSDRFVARFNFEVGRSDLRQDYKGNSREFTRVDSIVRDIINNKDITVSDIRIDGYASPEGNFQSNLNLSHNRADAFVNYLSNRYNLKSDMFHVTGHGEDWDGLAEALKASNVEWKDEVIGLIANNTIEGGREQKIMALQKGVVYKEMLADFYPPLRRTEYAFAYTVRPFSVEEAREVIKTKPTLLSLNEMYLVAQSYPEGSRERLDVLEVAAHIYPDNPVSRLNVLTTRLSDGNTDEEIENGLQKLDLPEAINNLGVLYARRGDYTKAAACFDKVASLKEAITNKKEMEKAKE